jgi:hypothetical protein
MKLTVCKNQAGTFRFSLNGKAMTLGNRCATLGARSGLNKLRETHEPVAYRSLSAIKVAPSNTAVWTSRRSATAVVNLSRTHPSSSVEFTNNKVTYIGDGTIEVCKAQTPDAGGLFVEGTFPVTITPASGTPITTTVLTGGCTQAYTVGAGVATVKEGSEPPYFLAGASTVPTTALGTVSTSTQTVHVAVAPSPVATTVTLDNDTALNGFKVCKVLADNEGALAGQTFTFDVSWSFTPPTAQASGAPEAPITGMGTVSVVAVPSPGENCTIFGGTGTPELLPVGTVVSVTEESFPNVTTSVVGISPPGQNDGSTATTATFTIAPTADGYTDAVFSNDPLGFVEVCKTFDPSSYNNGSNYATFTVNGGAAFDVTGGQCSPAMAVPAGTATVEETAVNGVAANPDFIIENVSTMSASDPFGVRLLTGTRDNPASVTVPYAGPVPDSTGNETVVTFTDMPDPTQFKICKQETSPDANLSGQTFSFDYSFGETSSMTSLTIGPSTTDNPTGEVCTGLIDGPVVVDESGDPIPVTVSETGSTTSDVNVTDIQYQGNGSVCWWLTTPTPTTDDSATVVFDPGGGINVITFTDGRTSPTTG